MSYIVPMKKPICINCPFRSLDSCTLIYLMSDKDSEVTVHVNEMTVSPDCPLVEIPTPHGRLQTIRTCWINDCTGFDGKAPCCLDCDERTHCPDKCSMIDTADCGGLASDSKGILKTDNQDTQRD